MYLQEFSQGYYCELWFLAVAKSLKITSKYPSLEQVKTVLNKYLSNKFKQAYKYIENNLDCKEFLDKILKTDCILEIENNQGKIEKIAIDITLNPEKVSKKLQEINRSTFVKSRQELNIDRHWILVVNDNYHNLEAYAVAEKLYEAIDNNLQVIDLR